jgi:hypothetical protein
MMTMTNVAETHDPARAEAEPPLLTVLRKHCNTVLYLMKQADEACRQPRGKGRAAALANIAEHLRTLNSKMFADIAAARAQAEDPAANPRPLARAGPWPKGEVRDFEKPAPWLATDGEPQFYGRHWGELPPDLHLRWWRETDYGTREPSPELIEAIQSAPGRGK